MRGLRILLPHADIGREVLADELRKRGADVTEVVAYRTVVARARARRRAGHLPDAARAAHRRRDVHERVGGPQLRAGRSAPSRPPTCCATTVVASIGPVTAEAAAQFDIETTIVPAHYTIPALVDAIVDYFAAADHE